MLLFPEKVDIDEGRWPAALCAFPSQQSGFDGIKGAGAGAKPS
jgi:hypothetical protein